MCGEKPFWEGLLWFCPANLAGERVNNVGLWGAQVGVSVFVTSVRPGRLIGA